MKDKVLVGLAGMWIVSCVLAILAKAALFKFLAPGLGVVLLAYLGWGTLVALAEGKKEKPTGEEKKKGESDGE